MGSRDDGRDVQIIMGSKTCCSRMNPCGEAFPSDLHQIVKFTSRLDVAAGVAAAAAAGVGAGLVLAVESNSE